jgi:hypothetical protein
VKVIISAVNPELLKLPVFASIIMDQFKSGAEGVDEEKIAQYIRGKRASAAPRVVDGSPEPDTVSAADSFPSGVAACEEESEFVLRNSVDVICFFQRHEEQFAHFFSLRGVSIALKAEYCGPKTRYKNKLPNSFLLKSAANEDLYFAEQYLTTLPSKLHPIQLVYRDVSALHYQQLVDIESRVMSCIRAHYSYSQHSGEEDPLSSELNISIRMKPRPDEIRYYCLFCTSVIVCLCVILK